MKPAPFEYTQALSWQDAVAHLSEHGDEAKVLAGGQTLVPAMNFRLARPSVLIDLNTIGNADHITSANGELRIGALARHVQFETPPCEGPLGLLIPRISRHIAHAPIRMRGTFAGSLAHADPASEWCALSATLDATIIAEGPGGEREIDARDFFVSILTTVLDAAEVIREIRLPVLEADWHCGFREFSRRAGDFALALAVACVRLHDGLIEEARIGIGGVCAVPFRSAEAEAALIGQPPTSELFKRAGEAAAETIDAMNDHHANASYRRDLVRALVPRALSDAALPGECAVMTTGSAKHEIRLNINGVDHDVIVDARRTLVDAVRDKCGMTGTHIGCEHGVCGACTILIDDEPVRSCLMFAVQAQGRKIRTVEGLAIDGEYSPLQQAFHDHHALQCGFCTPGMLMLSTWLVERGTPVDDEELREVVASNLCRCTGYQNILKAVRSVLDGDKP